ncbi:hypothetical protein D3C77_676010 [compost metagenome]
MKAASINIGGLFYLNGNAAHIALYEKNRNRQAEGRIRQYQRKPFIAHPGFGELYVHRNHQRVNRHEHPEKVVVIQRIFPPELEARKEVTDNKSENQNNGQ